MDQERQGLFQHQLQREILIDFYFSQGILFLCTGILLWWQERLNISLLGIYEIKWWLVGVGASLVVLIIALLLKTIVPKKWIDDGGKNQQLFQRRSVLHIFFIALISSFVEEWLFRGAIQHWLGVWGTSILFVLLHFRYLKKWLLVIYLLLVSVFLGELVVVSGVLAPAIAVHFIVNLCLGLYIRYKD
ncbi:CPBP family intramembrane glutamic endopeptidase [Thermoflavimicrobium daqui]|jgi:membrane protease YdiL (CAAX protease family)|uniref:CPBP family intramembrane metalloprotease n=1 Tax=Thermoflavimicrobium daqui TaxID=2137476 RepID=A0A364K2L1_9BACL|nr:CPBP family intramembrane glutamic endopeptidase [Thermoflavimicrobium daqui]RAL22655.1 CPBP family intramembrane metalloprotease [Thermoflavimicrobium daqui]